MNLKEQITEMLVSLYIRGRGDGRYNFKASNRIITGRVSRIIKLLKTYENN